MPAVSQALADFANQHRQRPGHGVEVTLTPRYQVTLQPDFPIPGPNSVSFIRCEPAEVDEVIAEARAVAALHHLPLMWTLDPDTRPADLGDRLVERGVLPDPHGSEAAVMVLPIGAQIAFAGLGDLEIVDALVDLETFRRADAVAAEAFMAVVPGDDLRQVAAQERRRLNRRAAGNHRQLLALVNGEPAGSAGLSLFPPGGAVISGGAVLPKFRGRGIYKALVGARLEIARDAGVAGLAVWGGRMSAPILERLGFVTVGRRRFFVDTTTG